MKEILRTIADKGSFVINGVCLSTGEGDGEYTVYACEKKPHGIDEAAWVDLRDCPRVNIWKHDCDRTSFQDLYSGNFYGADAIGIGFGHGDNAYNVYIWKMF